jgi:hypothetical protein
MSNRQLTGVQNNHETCARPQTVEDRIETQLQSVLAACRTESPRADRRRDRRYPFPRLLELTPVADDGCTPLADPVTVVGKDLSIQGIGFYHPQPLPYRRAIVALEDDAGRRASVLVTLSWCCFRRSGWYESGGRMEGAVP